MSVGMMRSLTSGDVFGGKQLMELRKALVDCNYEELVPCFERELKKTELVDDLVDQVISGVWKNSPFFNAKMEFIRTICEKFGIQLKDVISYGIDVPVNDKPLMFGMTYTEPISNGLIARMFNNDVGVRTIYIYGTNYIKETNTFLVSFEITPLNSMGEKLHIPDDEYQYHIPPENPRSSMWFYAVVKDFTIKAVQAREMAPQCRVVSLDDKKYFYLYYTYYENIDIFTADGELLWSEVSHCNEPEYSDSPEWTDVDKFIINYIREKQNASI